MCYRLSGRRADSWDSCRFVPIRDEVRPDGSDQGGIERSPSRKDAKKRRRAEGSEKKNTAKAPRREEGLRFQVTGYGFRVTDYAFLRRIRRHVFWARGALHKQIRRMLFYALDKWPCLWYNIE